EQAGHELVGREQPFQPIVERPDLVDELEQALDPPAVEPDEPLHELLDALPRGRTRQGTHVVEQHGDAVGLLPRIDLASRLRHGACAARVGLCRHVAASWTQESQAPIPSKYRADVESTTSLGFTRRTLSHHALASKST